MRVVVARKRKKGSARSSPNRGRFLRVRTAGIRVLNRFAFVILVLLGCVAVALLSVPEVKRLKALEAELAYTKELEAEAQARKDQKRRELIAIKEDPEYLELRARDRLDKQRPGEHIFRIDRGNRL